MAPVPVPQANNPSSPSNFTNSPIRHATSTQSSTTTARYHGLEVTIIGELSAGLLAIAGYGTPQELAIAAIAVKRRRGERVYCIAGGREWTANLDDAARGAVRAGEARDAGAPLARLPLGRC